MSRVPAGESGPESQTCCVPLAPGVAGTATTADGASAIAQRLAGISEGCSGEVLDVNDADGASNLVSRVTDTLGVPTILVNNAGITRDQILIRMKE